eukprot:UN18331
MEFLFWEYQEIRHQTIGCCQQFSFLRTYIIIIVIVFDRAFEIIPSQILRKLFKIFK